MSRLAPHSDRRPRLAVQPLERRENPAGMPWDGSPTVTVTNATVTEGAVASFVITPKPGHPVIDTIYITDDGTASGSNGPDFQIVTGRLRWAVGDNTPKVVAVQTFDDAAREATETFRLRVQDTELNTWYYPARPAWQTDGFGEIRDNEPPPPPPPPTPRVSVGDGRVVEGDAGSPPIMSFPVTLSAPSATPYRVTAATQAGTASAAAGDYTPRSAVLTWQPGESGTKYFDVVVTPDRTFEPDETFKVHLSAASNTTYGRRTGVGTIVNDDPRYRKAVAGVFRNGQWFLDTAGDGTFAERIVNFGLTGDTAVSADWNRDGFTDLTVVRPNPGTGRLDWYVDLNLDGQTDFVKSFGLIGDRPVAGDFDKNGRTDMGVVRKNYATNLLDWYLDLDGNGVLAERVVAFGLVSAGDVPVAADWNKDGKTDLAVYRPGTSYLTTSGQWIMNIPGPNGQPRVLNLGNAAWSPVAADFDGDGLVDAGLWRHNPERGGLDWLIDLGQNGTIDTGLYYGLPGDQVVAGVWA
jgi:hypothetical protein